MQQKGFTNDIYMVAIPDRFIEQGSIDELRAEIEMDAQSITKRILETLHK